LKEVAVMATAKTQRHAAGLFDIRNIIGALLFLYGVVLFIAGIVGSSSVQKAKAGGVNANLWVGIALLLVGGFFLVWAYVRPVVVPDDLGQADEKQPAGNP
jgi:uncharacterized membrane protein